MLIFIYGISQKVSFLQKEKENAQGKAMVYLEEKVGERTLQLKETNEELNQTNEELAAQRDEIEKQKSEAL